MVADDTPPVDVTHFAPSSTPPPGLRVLVGGVGELFQTDLDLGRIVVNQIMTEDELPRGTYVEDLSYGAIPFTHRLMELQPHVLVLVGAKQRGREPGSIHRRTVTTVDRTPEQLQTAVGDAYVGYVDLDLAVDVAFALDLLPPRCVVIEVEAAVVGPGDELSENGTAALVPTVAAVRREITLAPLFDLARQFRPRLEPDVLEPSRLLDALRELYEGFGVLDDEGRWGRTFQAKDHVTLAISSGDTSTNMDHADWGMTWGLVEELTRLQALAATDPNLQ